MGRRKKWRPPTEFTGSYSGPKAIVSKGYNGEVTYKTRTSPSRIQIQGGKSKFDASGTGVNRTASTLGTRVGLFTGAISINTDELEKMSVKVQTAIAVAMEKLVTEAAEQARQNAPRRTGDLAAGIYVTHAPTAEEMKAHANGVALKQHKMMGHSASYFQALNNVASREGTIVPGTAPEEDKDPLSSLVDARTQRIKGAAKSLPELTEMANPKRKSYAGLAEMLPFNSLPVMDMTTLYVGMGSAMYYSAWVEYGTSRMKARPFFTPAAIFMTSKAPAAMAAAIKSVETKVKPRARSTKR